MQCLCSAAFGYTCAVLVPGLFHRQPFISDLPGCLWKKEAPREIRLQRFKTRELLLSCSVYKFNPSSYQEQ